MTEGEDLVSSADVYDYRMQVAEEYELFCQWLANNNQLYIYHQFCDHLVFLGRQISSPIVLFRFLNTTMMISIPFITSIIGCYRR